MEVVPLNLPRRGSPAGAVGLPFNKRNVEEWSRLDRLTGIMETAKIETDHWAARSNNAAHKYGKMVDSRERNNQDGSLQERQRKQMEVFQTQVPGGSMQVIRTQTFTTSSKSSKWLPPSDKGFEDLKLPINSLDLSSQKTKGSVGRSGSIGGRRPPSRPRSLISQSSTTSIFEDSSVAKLCQRLHEEVKNEIYKNFEDFNGFNNNNDDESDRDSSSGVVITDITNNHHSNLSRQKSCSNENLSTEKEDDDGIFKRSKIRRSLQFPKQIHAEPEIDWCAGKSLKERAAEIENLLRRGGTNSASENKILENDEENNNNNKIKKIKTRDSFVSAEALNEVRDRLKKTNLSDNDDGIGTEKEEPSKVKCFVYGMEALMANRNVNGTGSLESKKNISNNSRSSEWYKRRKSYGFEQVEEPEKFSKINHKNIESSTDSGICRSSELIHSPVCKSVVTVGKKENENVNSVYVNNTPNVFSVRIENKEENRRQMFKSYDNEETVWNRKSPIPIQRKNELRESLKSSLRSAKNPWISQLRGTKLVDRNWISDEQNESENEDESVKVSNNNKKNKRVEFCKTEVHFAAEPGKFNIVETDGKPPPNDIFRRRKKPSHKTQSNLPELKFGDSVYEKRLLTNSEKMDSISEKIEAELKELSKIVVDSLPPSNPEPLKPSNPRPIYDLAEEPENHLPGSTPIWKSTVVLRNKHYDDVKEQKLYSSDGESELQIRFRNLRRKAEKKWWEPSSPEKLESKEIKRLSLPDESLLKNEKMTVANEEFPSLSVAERIKQVEELRSSNNYSSKINFRSGEMTVVQNGTGSLEKINGDDRMTSSSWLEKKSGKEFGDRPKVTCDNVTSSNPPVMRFPTQKDDKPDSQKYQTTRILINFESESNKLKTEHYNNNINNKTTARLVNSYGSWSPGMKKDLTKYFPDLKSTSLVKETISGGRKEEIPKPSKPVHEIINQFDSLTLPKRTTKEKRRKTMPINYKAPKEYTHADLEEELKNFTENLDKDFRDIYEEEIGSLKASSSLRDIKSVYETETSPVKKEEKIIQPVILNNFNNNKYNSSLKSSSEDGSKKSCPYASSRNYDSDDSDLMADEEVRSYMSAGQGGSDSESEEPYNSWNSRKSFKESILRFKKLEMNGGGKEIKSNYTPTKPIPSFADTFMSSKAANVEKPKIASIALRYEDDPLFAKNTKSTYTNHDKWEKSSNSSTGFSNQPRERISYLNGSFLSEKYSKYFSDSSSAVKTSKESSKYFSDSSTVNNKNSQFNYKKNYSEDSKPVKSFAETFGITDRKKPEKLVSSHRNSGRRNGIERKKSKEREETDSAILEELTKAADEILIAVNGYTDEDSHLASSEEEDKTRKIIRKDKMSHLSTISEGKRVTKTEARRGSASVSAVKRSVANHSSASSLESLTKETIRSRNEKPVCPRLKNAETKPMSSRATRLLQRANSREAVMAQPSSSEDIPNYVEMGKKRIVRRQKSSSSVKSDVSAESKTTCCRLKSKTKVNEPSGVSRVRERKSTTLKDSTNTAKSTRISQSSELDRTKSTARRSVTEKTETETTRRKRIPLTQNKDVQANPPSLRKKTTRVNSKKIEGLKPAQTA